MSASEPAASKTDNSAQPSVSGASAPDPDNPYPASLAPAAFAKNFVHDQKTIWTAPFKARIEDLNWIVPMTGLTVGLINADAELSSRISPTDTFSKHSGTISNAGVGAIVGVGGGLYLLGKWHDDSHQRETGILMGEALLNGALVDEVLKISTQRERPTDGTGQGRFWHGTVANSSFASNHAVMAWSAATVLAHEYPGPLTKMFAYGLATLVSTARVTGKFHFTSDAVVGSTLGYLIGRQVYASHHDPKLWGAGYGTFVHDSLPEGIPSDNIASPYVPMDSWVYPAFDRLSALGVIPSGIQGLRPWTRKECARLLEEASSSVTDNSGDEVSRLYAALAREFAPESTGDQNTYIKLDSVYARFTGISGTPLTDDYHFAKTIVNDYGRPYQHGANYLNGFSSSASVGAVGFYLRGEFEHAPSAPNFSPAVQTAIQLTDQQPLAAPVLPITTSPIPAFNQFRLLDTYVMLNLKGWQTSFGKQTLWTGPTEDPFLWSDNAEPIYMLRVDQTMPRKLPSFLGFLGPFRSEIWAGKLTGHHVVQTQDLTQPPLTFSVGRSLERQPMANGFKINFKPTPNFEFGVGRTGLWGGPDFPITLGTTKNSFISTGNGVGRNDDPGDRRSTFDFTYRIPGLRNYVKLYDDSFVEDEISPIGYPRRSAHNPGLYFSQLPWLPHMDLRAEASYTNLAGLIQPSALGGFFYWNTRYNDGYTNRGNVIGSGTVGRQGIAFRGDSTYWVGSDRTITFGYRTMTADPQFLQGGSFRDAYLRSEWRFTPAVSLSSFLQYEWWNFPLLTDNTRKNDFTASFQLTYWPQWKFGSGKQK